MGKWKPSVDIRCLFSMMSPEDTAIQPTHAATAAACAPRSPMGAERTPPAAAPRGARLAARCAPRPPRPTGGAARVGCIGERCTLRGH